MSGLLSMLASEAVWLPPQASTTAKDVDFVFQFIFYTSLFFFSLIVGLMIFFAIRYRRRKGYTPKPSSKSHLGVEIVWTAIPVVVVASIFWVGFKGFLNMVTPPDNTYEIQVIAQKWYWLFEYPNGWVDGELHVPKDQPVLLTMRSEDYIHSFFIPEFRLKMDVVPGRYNKTWFEATKAGTYDLLCTEYCGTGHSDMITKVVVHEPGGYEKWLRDASNLLSPLLRPRDFSDAAGFVKRLRDGEAPAYEYFRSCLGPVTLALIGDYADGTEVPEELHAGLVKELNAVLGGGESIHTEDRFAGVTLSDDTSTLLAREDLPDEDLIQLNRYLLSDAFPDSVTRGPNMAEAGKYIYERKGGCGSCHRIDGQANIGPSLLGIFGQTHPIAGGEKAVVDENYIRESILDPQAKIVAGYEPVMPTYQGRFTDREIDAIIAFLKSLDKKD